MWVLGAEYVPFPFFFTSVTLTVLCTLRLTPSTVIWRSGVIYGFDRQKLILRRNLRWFYFWRLTVGFTVIYGGKPSGFSYLRWETVSSWPGQARLNWLRAHTSPLGLIFGGHFIFISQMLFVGKSGHWERPLSLSLSWHSEPLSTWRRTVTYDFRPSV